MNSPRLARLLRAEPKGSEQKFGVICPFVGTRLMEPRKIVSIRPGNGSRELEGHNRRGV
jgi:hypothetical protein